MKLKRILSLLLCSALVTTGGVYATWNYAAGSVSDFNGQFAKPAMAQANLDAAIGTLSVDTTGLKVSIDDTNGDKVAELVMTGEVTVTFTPSASADPDIQNNGIALKYSITGVNAGEYKGSPIFTFTPVTDQTLSKGKSWTIPAEELKSVVAINTISLPTYADYQALQGVLPSVLLSITVEQAL